MMSKESEKRLSDIEGWFGVIRRSGYPSNEIRNEGDEAMFKPGQRVLVMNQTPTPPFGEVIEEGDAIIVVDNDFNRGPRRSCDVRFVKDIKRDGPNCPVYIRWIDTRKINWLPLKPGGVLRCCIETLETTPVEGKEGEVLPCKHCSESLILRSGCWEWNQEIEETKP